MHVMLDLETMDTATSAIVVSIGAVKFDPAHKEPGRELHVRLSLDPQAAKGRTISPSTMVWWMKQTDSARSVFDDESAFGPPTMQVSEAIAELEEFCRDAEGVWGNGSDFDNAIIASLCKSFGLALPWKYSKNRCFRTMKSLPPPKTFVKPEFGGERHNALDDAVYQARYLQAIVAATGIKL